MGTHVIVGSPYASEVALDGDPGNAAGPLDGSGLIPLAQLPPAALTAKVLVADQTARYALTAAQVQEGDLVRQTDTGRLYAVVDTDELDNSAGYQDLDEASMAALSAHLADTSNAHAPTSLGPCATDRLLGRTSSGSGAVEEIPISDFVQGLLDDADAATARATLGAASLGAGKVYHALYHRDSGTMASGHRISTAIPASASGDGDYIVTLYVRFAGANTLSTFEVGFTVASGALSGTPVASCEGPHASGVTLTIGTASSVFVIHVGLTQQCELFATVRTAASEAYCTGWTVSNAASTGTAVSIGNTVQALTCTTLAMGGALSGATTGAFSSTLTAGGDVILTQTNNAIRTNGTAKRLGLRGGDASTPGAFINLHGSTYGSGAAGALQLIAAEIANAEARVAIYTGATATSRIAVENDGTVTLHATTAASLATALGVGWTTVSKSTDETISSDNTLSNDSALTFSALANTKYRFRLKVWFSSDGDADFQFGLAGPTAPTLFLAQYQRGASGGSYSWDSTVRTSYPSPVTNTDGGTAAYSGWVWIEGILHNAGNAGTFAFQWAQNSSDASNCTVLAGSYLEYKVA